MPHKNADTPPPQMARRPAHFRQRPQQAAAADKLKATGDKIQQQRNAR